MVRRESVGRQLRWTHIRGHDGSTIADPNTDPSEHPTASPEAPISQRIVNQVPTARPPVMDTTTNIQSDTRRSPSPWTSDDETSSGEITHTSSPSPHNRHTSNHLHPLVKHTVGRDEYPTRPPTNLTASGTSPTIESSSFSQMATFTTIPLEVLLLILRKLDTIDVTRLGMVSRASKRHPLQSFHLSTNVRPDTQGPPRIHANASRLVRPDPKPSSKNSSAQTLSTLTDGAHDGSPQAILRHPGKTSHPMEWSAIPKWRGEPQTRNLWGDRRARTTRSRLPTRGAARDIHRQRG